MAATDKPVCRFFIEARWLQLTRMETNASMFTPYQCQTAYDVPSDVVLRHIVFKIAPILADNSLHGQAVPNLRQGAGTPTPAYVCFSKILF